MAFKRLIKITLYDSFSQTEIDDIISSSDTPFVELDKNYFIGKTEDANSLIVPTELNGYPVNYLDALKKVIDISTFKYEQNLKVFIVQYNEIDKEFDLTASYVRTNIDTTAAQGTITTGFEIEAVFVTPGLEGVVETTVTLPFNSPISTTDLAALTAVGLDMNFGATGSLFSLKTQSVPFKVRFNQPVTSVENVLIKFPLRDITIEI